MNGIIMFNDKKEPHIRVRWQKVAYDAKVDYNADMGKAAPWDVR